MAEKAARHLKRMAVLDLAGQNPLIVLADGDFRPYAVNATAFGTFLHQGQIACRRDGIIVERPVGEGVPREADRQDEGLKGGSPTEMDTTSAH